MSTGRILTFALFIACFISTSAGQIRAQTLEIKPGAKIVFLGNTLAERSAYFGHLETRLHARLPEHKLVVRNLGWSADTINLRLRSLNFDDHGHTLRDHDPDLIFAFFGFNESFAGKEGVETFKTDLAKFLDDLKRLHYPTTTIGGTHGPGSTNEDADSASMNPPRIVLVSPIAVEKHDHRPADWKKNRDADLKLYTNAMQEVAKANDVVFVNLFTPTKALFAESEQPLTINGIHLNEAGYAELATIFEKSLFGDVAEIPKNDYATLRAAVNEKNQQFWYDYRAVNGYYIYGDRKKPFGVVNFPAEFEKLRNMIEIRDQRIWKIAAGESVPDEIDDGGTGEFVDVQSNVNRPITYLSPEESMATFKLADGFAVTCFASEETFPELRNPCQFSFDSKGRLWVCTMQSYPMYLPSTPPDDKILILEDTDGDGVADQQTIFADGLYMPTGIELFPGGAYVAQQPNLMRLEDTDGDDKADIRTIVLGGFDTADAHHAISAFTWGPDGGLYFQEGTFLQSQIETPYGPTRCVNAGVYRYEPRTDQIGVFVSYSFANPWGHTFNQWGQNFVADASGGANYFGTAFSGQVDFPRKHASLKQFLKKQWRPTSGCEIVSSENFPEEIQGNYLLNNVIGFQGILNYHVEEEGSGFVGTPAPPLLQSSDVNFRPVDLEFGPDGALYICDWYNPLIGHMQHSVRDPKRDNTHGRIYRIHYTKKPLDEPAKIAGASIPELLELLKDPVDRVRYRVRTELRGHDAEEVAAAVDAWLAKLDENDPHVWHHRLEGLWAKQQHGVVDPVLLESLLTCEQPRARAAATRVVAFWREELADPLVLLQRSINDEHPRVRLEAIRALSFFDGQRALNIASESLLHEQDNYLEYTLNETFATLEGRLAAPASGK